jgi:hypothetical protein
MSIPPAYADHYFAQLADIMAQLASLRFPSIGSITEDSLSQLHYRPYCRDEHRPLSHSARLLPQLPSRPLPSYLEEEANLYKSLSGQAGLDLSSPRTTTFLIWKAYVFLTRPGLYPVACVVRLVETTVRQPATVEKPEARKEVRDALAATNAIQAVNATKAANQALDRVITNAMIVLRIAVSYGLLRLNWQDHKIGQ